MFRDRAAAGRVLAVPAGGVPVAAEIALALELPLVLAPVSKVLLPWTTESGYGAVAFDGTEWIDEEAAQSHGLSAAQRFWSMTASPPARRCARLSRHFASKARRR